MIQKLLTNVRKHAKAMPVGVVIQVNGKIGQKLLLRITESVLIQTGPY